MSRKPGSTNVMLQVIEEGITGIYKTDNILARIWRIVIFKANITGQSWHNQLSQWQSKLNKEVTSKKKASIKGNITRALAESTVSWDTLMKGFTILGFTKMDMHITLHKRGKTIEFPLVIDLTTLKYDDNDSDDEQEPTS